MDELTIRLKRQLGRAKLDQAEILTALVTLATENPAVFGALAARLQSRVRAHKRVAGTTALAASRV